MPGQRAEGEDERDGHRSRGGRPQLTQKAEQHPGSQGGDQRTVEHDQPGPVARQQRAESVEGQQKQRYAQPEVGVGLVGVPGRVLDLEGVAQRQALGDPVHHLAVIAKVRTQREQANAQHQGEEAQFQPGRCYCGGDGWLAEPPDRGGGHIGSTRRADEFCGLAWCLS